MCLQFRLPLCDGAAVSKAVLLVKLSCVMNARMKGFSRASGVLMIDSSSQTNRTPQHVKKRAL